MSAPIDYEKIRKAAQLSVDREFSIPEAGEEDRRYTGPEIAWLDFVSLATPSAVLALLAEIDRNSKNSKEWEAASLHWVAERDQLKAELESLRSAKP